MMENESSPSSSSESTPTKRSGPFSPVYSVLVPDAIKNGEALQFTIKVCKPDSDEEISSVTRVYDDIEWLQHCLLTHVKSDGCIIPPLPPRPECDARAAENKTKKQLGSESHLIIADDFTKDCRHVEKYFKMITSHEVFGDNDVLKTFLCVKDAPTRTRLKRGLLNRLTSVVEEARKGQHKDMDDYFQKQRDWANKYTSAMKETSQNFNQMLYSQMRLGSCYGHLATALTDVTPYKDKHSKDLNKYVIKIHVSHGMEVLCANDEKTLGFHLDLYARYMDCVKDMLYRRTMLMVAYEDSNKTLEKAKANKRDAAEAAKRKAEEDFEKCSDVARRELKVFMQQRLLSFSEGLSAFAEAQIKTARDTYTLLVKTQNSVKQLDLLSLK
ncbi:hypothetical protein FSP39_018611 [Pinctada imbricata]|uniref:Uncharacterized protein n=1 Tax=Pinctada imbricata TaxID=66713 RepID=A0AA89BXM8_PINIB|nr:hypothetical protein FSP39_018611 [Pinctada imbricata]